MASRFTDALSPIGNPGYSDRSLIEIPTRLGLTGAAAGVTGGASIPAQWRLVRGIDALTGRRSAVASSSETSKQGKALRSDSAEHQSLKGIGEAAGRRA